VRDEDLRTQPEAEFPRVMQFIDGRPPRREEVEGAMTFASFESPKAEEAANYFRS